MHGRANRRRRNEDVPAQAAISCAHRVNSHPESQIQTHRDAWTVFRQPNSCPAAALRNRVAVGIHLYQLLVADQTLQTFAQQAPFGAVQPQFPQELFKPGGLPGLALPIFLRMAES